MIELPDGNNVVPLRSDTIRLVQNGCSFHELWFDDPNQHLKDFLKLVDSLDLDVANREKTRLRLLNSEMTSLCSNNIKEKNIENNKVVDKNVIELSELNAIDPKDVVDMKKEVKDRTNDEPVRSMEEEITRDGIEELVEMPRSQPVGYYLKQDFNEKLIEGLIESKEESESDIGPVAPTNTVSRMLLEWEERIKLHREKEMEFNQ
ncbi:hypothetical protein Tco_1359990 [Tanacetum coccineum]